VISIVYYVLKIPVIGEYNEAKGGERMKKLTTAGLLLVLAMSLSACGGGEKPSSAPAEQNNSQSQSQTAATSGGGDDAKKIMEGKCISCHGQNLEGGAGPKLADVGARLSKDEIEKTIKTGRGIMPGGLLSDEETKKVASYLADKK
jgi:cytochrome c551